MESFFFYLKTKIYDFEGILTAVLRMDPKCQDWRGGDELKKGSFSNLKMRT